MASRSHADALEAARREGTEIGRRIGLSQATGELLQILNAPAIERDALWKLVERWTAMSAAPPPSSPEPAAELPRADEASFDDESTVIDGDEVIDARAESDAEGSQLRMTVLGGEEDGSARGARWFLGLRPVEPRSRLELLLTGGRWIQGTFEWTGRSEDPPTFHVVLGGDWEPKDVDTSELAALPTMPIPRVSFPLPSFARLRWPLS